MLLLPLDTDLIAWSEILGMGNMNDLGYLLKLVDPEYSHDTYEF